MKLELSMDEAQAILRLLDWTLPEMREEIYKTEAEPMRKRVKEQERLLRGLRERIDETLAKEEVAGVS
ncbi:MAG: hypothetical protein ACYCWW_10550 [Deltaproteobacteria bacterium]